MSNYNSKIRNESNRSLIGTLKDVNELLEFLRNEKEKTIEITNSKKTK